MNLLFALPQFLPCVVPFVTSALLPIQRPNYGTHNNYTTPVFESPIEMLLKVSTFHGLIKSNQGETCCCPAGHDCGAAAG